MKITAAQIQAVMTCREFHAMTFQQIADHLFMPTHLVREAYEDGCRKGLKAKIPQVSRPAYVRVDQKEKEKIENRYDIGAKKRRSKSWKSLTKSERDEIRKRAKKSKHTKKKKSRTSPSYLNRDERLARFKAKQAAL
jgi:uncharacterized protein (DUF2126 family)